MQRPTHTTVSGRDPGTRLCISVVFMLRELSDRRRHCEDFERPMFPYVVMQRADRAGCWDYGSAVQLESIRGCVDFAAFGPGHADEAHLTLTITSEPWSGTVIFDASREGVDVAGSRKAP